MFNGYNDSALISYELNQEREKKLDNVSKYSYGHDGGVQSTPTHPNNLQSDFWSGKPNFVGVPNVVKCNCTGCYPTTENQSYQVQSTRHRPWLPKTYSVLLNGSNDCKLPAYQWDSALNHMYYPNSNVPYDQENAGKLSYYGQFQTPNQPGVIISANKQRSEMGFQNGVRQPMMCNQGYDLTKRVNGRNYFDEEKYSLGAHSVNQIPRLPVEPYTKAVPSNLNQNRVPSTGHRKENSPQCDHFSGTKIFPENYYPGLSSMDLKNSRIHVDYSYFNRDPDSYRSNYTEIKRNNMTKQIRKDCSVTQVNVEQHYGRTKHVDNLKGCEVFYPNFEKNQLESCIQRIESDGIDRIARSVAVCNDLRYSDERPQEFPHQSNADCRNYVRPEYPQFNSQWMPGFQETDQNQCKTLPHQLQSYDQKSQGSNGCIIDSLKSNSEKTQSYERTQLIVGAQAKLNYIETIRSEELTKNGTNKISPLRLLRKKKLTTAPQEPSTKSTPEAPMLDVRKFWSTWAEEEDENVASTQMVVLDCQNIDPEQAKLLNFYETDSSRPINLENVLKNSDWAKDGIENVKTSEQPVGDQDKLDDIPTQIEPVVKNSDEVTPSVEGVKISPKKHRSHEFRKKKKEEVMDKWTEKKFDFLKRSEESKAAEIIRYEEEKKKIFERRLSFQHIGVGNIEKPQEDVLRLEENCQINSPRERVSDLPTSEYRRNKFLDYSEGIVNGCKDSQKTEDMLAEQSMKTFVKKEEPDIKQDTDSSSEMNDILKKITEINFEEMKLESGLETSKKTKKTKEKKLEQSETDAKAGLKLETMSKPTIKFSIQKSHDLKISFKVLNKKYEEDVQRIKFEETKPMEDVNTELITLKYKSIQNGGKLSESKKKKGKLWRKKLAPAFKKKKSRYTEEKGDPIPVDVEAKTCPVDDFQVQETVDSAKIKLTFKRHKTNLETEYKIDSEGLNVGSEDKNFRVIENKHKKKSKKAKKRKIYILSDTESSHLEQKSTEQHAGALCGSEDIHKNVLESAEEYSEKSHLSCSTKEEEIRGNLATPFEMILPEKRLCELPVQTQVTKESRCEFESEEQLDLIVNCDEASGSNDKYDKFLPDKYIEEAISKSSENGKKREEYQGISLDFIRTINSPNIEKNQETEKTEEIEGRDVKEGSDTNGGTIIESTNVNHSILKKNVNCSEIKSGLTPISLDERNAIPKSDSDNVGAEMTEKDALGVNVSTKWLNIYRPETDSEINSSSKFIENNFEEYDSLKQKIEDFENMNSRRLANHLECPEVGDEGESEKFHLNFDKLTDRKHSESSELKPNSPLLPNENTRQLETADSVASSDNSQSGKWVEPGVAIVRERDASMENPKPFEKNSGVESQTIDSQKVEIKESKPFVKDEATPGGFTDDEQKTYVIESEFDNCISLEKQDELYESHAVRIHDSKLPFEKLTSHVENEIIKCDYILSEKSDEPGTEGAGDNSITEQTKPEYIDFDSHLLNRNCDVNNTEDESVHFKNKNQRTELINLENISRSSDSDYLIHVSGHTNEETDVVTEKETEVICISKNSPSSEARTQFSNQLQTAERVEGELNGDDINEINEPDIKYDSSTCDDQIVKDSNQIEPENISQFLKEKPRPAELPEATHFTLAFFDDVQGTSIPETCNHEPHNFILREDTRIDDTWDKDKLEQVSYFEDDRENLTQTNYLEKQGEEDKQSGTLFSNDKLTFVKPQENTVVMENNQANFSGCASSVDDSRRNSLTDPVELKEETDFAKNSLPQLKELACSYLESPSSQESELEEGEVVDDSSDDSELTDQTASLDVRKIIEFKIQKPIRRHSVHFRSSESTILSSWCRKKFTKSKSCPPRFEIKAFEPRLNIAVRDIPLPVGPPPLGSCYHSRKIIQETKASEDKEKQEKISEVQVSEVKEEETIQELPCGSPFGAIELQKCRNPSPPRSDALGTHRNKIKFTLTKRSRFSKIGLQLERPKVFKKLFEKSELKVTVPEEDSQVEMTKTTKKPDLEVNKTTGKSDMRFNETIEKPDPGIVEFSKKCSPKSPELEKIQRDIFKQGDNAEVESVESSEKSEIEITKPFEKSELEIEVSETEQSEAIEPTENLESEVIESSINISNETANETSKIRTPDFVSETVEDISECQIAKVPNASPIPIDVEDQKSDLEVESLCENANVGMEDVMNDFMRAEFYEDMSTSKDLPNGNFVEDEKVNDDKFRSIMQNCLENTKKFLNVGNLKLFSCSVDDLLELDNQEIEPAANHISRDVLLTSCEDANDDLGLNEKFQPVDISMEFVPSDVCPEILPVDNWPYLEEEVPSSPIKSNETDLILENTISGVVPNRKRVAKESENYKRFRRKSLIENEDALCSKIAAHRRKTIDGLNNFLSYSKFNGIEKPNESLKCRLSLEKLTKNGVEFICPQDDFPKKVESVQLKKKLNYKSPLWQPKVMLIRIPENEMKRFKKAKSHSRSAENLNSLPAIKKQKSGHRNSKCPENEVILSIPPADSIKGQIFSSPDVKKHKPRFRNLHTKRKPERGQIHREVETALSEIFKEPDEGPKNNTLEKTNKSAKIAESEVKAETKSDRRSSKNHSLKDEHDHRDRRRESGRGRHRDKEKRKREQSKLDDGKKPRNSNSDDDKNRSLLKSSSGKKEAWVCEVCGFDDASERVSHIKNHPFHCQSCHLAFKTEIYFTSHLTEMHKDIRNQHHCLLCELSFDTEGEYQRHLETREHTHLEAVEKNTINTLFTLLTGAPCPVLGVVEMKPEWLPNQPGTVHFYHQATPLSLALQYIKMHRDFKPCSGVTKVHQN